MATSSIKAPIMVTSAEGAMALCEAYEAGVAADSKAKVKEPAANGFLSSEKKKSIDELFSAMGF